MKKLMKSLMLVAAAAMALTSCKNEVIDSVESGEKFTMNFIADAPESRTSVSIEGNKASFAWNGDEDFQFIQYQNDGDSSYMYFGSEVTAEKSGDQLLISATFNGEEATEYHYVAIHPASGRASNNNDDFNNNKLIIPGNQTLTAGNYDPNADLLVSQVVTATGAVSEAQALRFTRLVAIGEMNLKGMQLDGEEFINSVTFSVESAKLTGRCYVDLATASVSEYGYTNEGTKTTEIVLTTAEGESFAANAASTKVYFTCAPVELASGSSYTIIVDTDKAVYTKSATLGDNALSFGVGSVTAFGVNMATAERVKKVTSTETWSLVTDASSLAAGDEVIIAAAGSPLAMSTTQNNNNRGVATISKNDDTNTITFESTAGVQIFDLQSGSKEGTFAFYDSTLEGYLYAASSSKNYLKTGSFGDNASWTIEIGEGGVATIKAQGDNTRNWMRYNSTSTVFSAYGSGQNDVVLYRLENARPALDAPTNVVASANGETVTVSWTAVSGAKDYTVRAGDVSATTAETTCTLTVGYGKTITASVVANPSSDSYKPSAATFSNEVQTETESSGEGDEGGTTTPDLPATGTEYVKVTSAPTDWSGTYLIVCETAAVAFNGGLSTLDAVANTIKVTINNSSIKAEEETNAAAFTIAKSDDGYTVKSASGKYIGVTSYNNGLKETEARHSISLDTDANAQLVVTTENGNMTLRFNSASDQMRFRYYKSGQKAIQLYKLQ